VVKSHEKNVGQYHNIQRGIKSIENVVKLKYLNRSNTPKFHSWKKSRLKSINSCYHSVQNLLPSCLLSKNINMIIYGTVFSLLFSMGLKLGHIRRRDIGWRHSRMCMLRKVYGPKRDQGIGSGENCVMRSFMICTPCQTLFT